MWGALNGNLLSQQQSAELTACTVHRALQSDGALEGESCNILYAGSVLSGRSHS